MCVYGKDVLTFVIIQKTEDEARKREEKKLYLLYLPLLQFFSISPVAVFYFFSHLISLYIRYIFSLHCYI